LGTTRMIIEHKEIIPSTPFKGTIIDIETIGEFTRNRSYTTFNDSRQCGNLQQVIFGQINDKELQIFCAKGRETIEELKSQTEQILNRLERPFYAFNADFESSVWFHHVGIIINFDGELQKFKFEKKVEARKSLNILNYDDPFNDDGWLCSKAWHREEFDKAIAHNRACLLKERDILLKREYREPNKVNFNK
jgi:hypothetical protein